MKKLSLLLVIFLIAAIAIAAMPILPKEEHYVKMTKNEMPEYINIDDVLAISNYELLFENEAEPISYETLYDLDDYPAFMLVEFEPLGYAIINRETGEYAEFSEKENSPYKNHKGFQNYYVCPGAYYYKRNNNFVNIFSNEILTKADAVFEVRITDDYREHSLESTQKSIEPMAGGGSTGKGGSPGSLDKYYIPHPEFFFSDLGDAYGRNDPKVNNSNGICGSVSAAITLTYMANYVDESFIKEEWRNFTGTNSPNIFGSTEGLRNHLVNLIEPSGGGSWAYPITQGLNSYFNQLSCVNANSTWTTTVLLTASIRNHLKSQELPIIACLADVLGSPYNDHVVTVFGYTENNSHLSDSEYFFYAHLGWHGQNTANIDTKWVVSASFVYHSGSHHKYTNYTNLNSTHHTSHCECGVNRTETHTYTHTKLNSTNHTSHCACGVSMSQVHSFTTTVKGGHSVQVCVCGYTRGGSQCTYASSYKIILRNNNVHLAYCSCGLVTEKMHQLLLVIGNPKKSQCTLCGYLVDSSVIIIGPMTKPDEEEAC